MDYSPPGSSPWDFPDKDTGVGCHFLLQEIFPTQGWNLHLLLGRQILYHGATRETPLIPSISMYIYIQVLQLLGLTRGRRDAHLNKSSQYR